MTGASEKALPPGTRFGQYELIRLIGWGGMGAVYEASHTRLKKRVALKALHPQVLANTEAVSRFLREGEAAARIRHPHVVDVFDLGVHDDVPFLVMEYLEGEDLGALLDRETYLPVSRAVEIMLGALSAMHAAHAAGVVHRDLKPDNVFLARGRHGEVIPKVLDFGISKVADERNQLVITTTSVTFGTPHYMSPEQVVGGKDIDSRADLYALGVILYECVTGKKPFEGEALFSLLNHIVHTDAPAASALRADLPPGIDAVVARAMARERDTRFATAREMGDALLPYADPKARAAWQAEFVTPSTVTVVGPGLFPLVSPDDAAGAPSLEALSRVPPPPAPGAAVSPVHAPAVVPGATGNVPRGVTARDDTREPPSGVVVSARPHPARTPRWVYGFAAALAALVVIGAASALRSRSSSAAAREANTPATVTGEARTAAAALPGARAATGTYPVRLTVAPAGASIELDGVLVGVGSLVRELPRDGTTHTLRVSAPGHDAQTVRFADVAPPTTMVLAAVVDGGAAAGSALNDAPRAPNGLTGAARPPRVGAHAPPHATTSVAANNGAPSPNGNANTTQPTQAGANAGGHPPRQAPPMGANGAAIIE